jgi:hypothetical protein
MLSGESLRGRRVTECPPSGSRQNIGAPLDLRLYSGLRRVWGLVLFVVMANVAGFAEEDGVFADVDGEIADAFE